MSKSGRRRHYTETGRVVYDRKKHEFNPNDVARIARVLIKKKSSPAGKVFIYLSLTSALFEVLVDLLPEDNQDTLITVVYEVLLLYRAFFSDRISRGISLFRSILTLFAKETIDE